MSTKNRFQKGARDREKDMFEKIINILDQTDSFKGIKTLIKKVEPVAEQTDLKDLIVYFADENKSRDIAVEMQETKHKDYEKYHQIRIDYISVYYPPKRYSKQVFFDKLEKNEVSITKWGKLYESDADLLFFYTYDYDTIKEIFILDWKCVQRMKDIIIKNGDFKTNIKRGEDWGSAFIAVNPDLIEDCIIRDLDSLKNLLFG